MIRVVVADDHALFVRAVTTLLGDEADIEVVATACDGEEAVAAALAHAPDVVLMDLHMPGLNGIEATSRLAMAAPHVGVLVLTMFDDDDSVVAAVRAGARGYVLKGARQEEMARAIRAVHAGDLILGRSVARRLGGLVSRTAAAAARPFPELTTRELEVLEHVARGLDNTTIGRQLFLSEKTVRNYVSGVFTKLGVTSRAEAVVRAREAGLGTA